MNPLNRYPKVREALYLVQWIVTGIQTVLSAAFAFIYGDMTGWPDWFLLSLAVAPVLWTYLGTTAKANVNQPVEVQGVVTMPEASPEGYEVTDEFDLPTDSPHGGPAEG